MKSLKACAAGPVRRAVRHSVGTAVAMSLLLALGAPVASAAPDAAGPGWAFKASFGNFDPFVYETPRSPVAVDGSGNVFAVDQNPGAIRIYSPDTAPLTEFGGGIPRNLAIDQSDDAVYVDEVGEFGGSTVRRYLSDGQPTPTYSVDPSFEVPQGAGIAVDPTTGDLLVADAGTEGVRRYDSSGTLLETIATPSINPAWIVAAPDGSFYVAPAEGPDVTHFSGAGTQLGTIAGEGSLHGLAYDASRSVVVVAVGDKLKSYSPAGALLVESPAQGGGGIGLAVSASGALYEHAVTTLNFYAPGTIPGVEAPHVSGIAGASAHVSAEVDPGAGPPEGSVAHFEYSADGGASWTSTPDVSVERTGSEEPDTVEADLTGLKANTDYLVRLVAGNSAITRTSGSTPFKSAVVPPTAVTGAATGTVGSTATLSGSVNPNGSVTTFFFEYGSTAAYGSRIPLIPAPVGGGYTTSQLSRTITGLVPGETYHFRIVAENEAGTTEGDDRTFVAGSAQSEGRAYEQVTPVDSRGTLIDMQNGVQALWGPTGLSYVAKPPGEGTASAPHFSRRLAVRGDDGWESPVAIDPPIQIGNLNLLWMSTVAVSRDSTHSLAVTNAKLTPDAIEGPEAANIYLKNLKTGSYELVASTSATDALREFINNGDAIRMFMEGSDDFSTVVLFSDFPLLPGVTGGTIYRWTRSDGLEVMSRLPDGSNNDSPVVRRDSKEVVKRVVTTDGSAALFGLQDGRIFMRVDDETVPVAVSELDGEEKEAIPSEMDANGRYALFITATRMTADTPVGGENPFIYRYDIQTDDLVYIDEVSERQRGVPFRAVHAISPDGQSVVYTDRSEKISIWHQGKKTELLENGFNTDGVWGPQFNSDSKYFAFSYASVQFAGGSRAETEGDVYLYDVDSEQLSCSSCIDGQPTTSAWFPSGERIVSNRLPRVLDDDGRLFFTSSTALLPQDTNGVDDVYGFQAGQLSLITPGKAPYPAYLMDISKDGRDVYFGTDQSLVGQDTNRERDIYDARIGGGFPSQNTSPPAPCSGEGCLGIASPAPPPGLIGSESATGAGQKKRSLQHRCKKGRVRVKGRCVKRKGRKAGKKTASLSATSGAVR